MVQTIFRVKESKWNAAKHTYERVAETYYDEYKTALATITRATGRTRRDRKFGGVKRTCEFFTSSKNSGYYFVLSRAYEKETWI